MGFREYYSVGYRVFRVLVFVFEFRLRKGVVLVGGS